MSPAESSVFRTTPFVQTEEGLWEGKRLAARGTYLCAACRCISIERLCSPFTFFPKRGIFEVYQIEYPEPPGLSSTIDGEHAPPECSFCQYLWIFPGAFIAKLNEATDDFQRPDGPKLSLVYHSEWKGGRAMDNRYDLDIWTDEGDPAMESGIRAKRPIYSTGSKHAAEWVKQKLLQCTSRHVRCCQTHAVATSDRPVHEAAQPGDLPARLIDLNAHASLDAMLVDTVNLSNPVYAALSYCWGANTATNYRTTALNIAEQQQRIQYAHLPLTIRHAVDFTRGLGVQYLWIDALCIVQGSASDWERELAKMHRTYGNAYVTMAVDSGESVDAGVFNESSIPMPLQTAHVVSQLSDGRTSSLYFRRMPSAEGRESLDSTTYMQPLSTTVLASRAWAYQERRLSPRIVHFNERQIVWECRELILSEDNTWYAPIPVASRDPSLAPCILFEPLKDVSVLPDFWYGQIDGVLEKYTACGLTFPDDRLPAISGMAAKIATCTTSPYIAGLWLDHALQRGLAWRRRTDLGNRWTHRPERGPSFSWVAWDGLLRWETTDAPPAFTVEKHSIALKGSSQFGRVGPCSLTLTGRMLPGSIKAYKVAVNKGGGDHHAYFGDRRSGNVLMDWAEVPAVDHVEFFQIFESYSTALLLENTAGGEYRRLGFANLDKEDVALFKSAAGKTITLI